MQDHRLIHCHLYINGASVMLSDAFPEFGHPLKEPQGFNLLLAVDDVDAWWKRAIEAGAEIVMPLELQFWGERYGQLRDPFGVTMSAAPETAQEAPMQTKPQDQHRWLRIVTRDRAAALCADRVQS